MVRTKLRRLSAFILIGMTLGALGSAPGQAQGNSRNFPETGKTVSGRFLEYWNTHGGLAQQRICVPNPSSDPRAGLAGH